MKVSVFQSNVQISEITLMDDDLINGGELFIGREEDCHIVLDDQQVSRHHAALKLKEGSLFIEVLSSFGLVKVNGNQVKSIILNETSKVEIGSFELAFSQLERLCGDSEQVDRPSEPVVEEALVISEELVTDEDPFADDKIENEQNLNITHSDAESSDDEIDFADESDDEDNFSMNDDTTDSGGNDVFHDDSFGDSDHDENDGDATQVFKSFANYSLQVFGEYAPLDRYQITDKKIFIGRDKEKCQIILNDPEVSSVHAVINKTLMGCILEDLDSANGTLVAGERINTYNLVSGVEFLIGSTSFTVDVSSDILDAEKDILMPVEQNQEIDVEEIVEEEVDFDEFEGEESGDDGFALDPEEEKSFIKKIMNDPKKKRIAFAVIIIFIILLLLPDEEPAKIIKKGKKSKASIAKAALQAKAKKKYSPRVLEQLEQNYALAKSKFENGEFADAKEYVEKVFRIDENYKKVSTLRNLILEGYEELLRLKREEQEEKERKRIMVKVNALVEKAKIAVKNREVQVSEALFGQVYELDPENLDIPILKSELDAYKEAEELKKNEIDRKKALRDEMKEGLASGKTLYIQEEWYRAVIELEKYSQKKGIDDDYMSEATKMLKTAKRKLRSITSPLLSKARSFKEGQDLKQAYETYGEILKYAPGNEEALNQRDAIFTSLLNRSRRIYREALIAESLSLFEKAKQKFQEVQQVSPVNSEYYIKASEKLTSYLE